jgi:hypothetical protein
MTRDDIIRMATESGIDCDNDGDIWGSTNGALLRFFEMAQAAEREACAKVCDDNAITMPKSEYAEACQDCAYIIRARGEK